jgi:V8-like Glu-specific endopeptidase
MKSIIYLFLALTVLPAHSSIYGIDDRIEANQNNNPYLSKVISSTAAMIANEFITPAAGNNVEITAPLFKEIYRLCPTERFRDQITAANCSGTLIGKDIILTAGHCFAEAGLDCKGYSWVFDYRLNNNGSNKFILPRTNVYKCKQILKKVEDKKRNIDYALIRLDRDVLDRVAVDLRLTGDIEQKSKMAAIGHPRGLPTKIAQHGDVQEIMPDSFRTNLDTYTMNSGSGVFNEATGELEGVLISGAKDFSPASNSSCNQSSIYDQADGKEIVMKIKNILKDIELF